jgi:hypothetical protein
MRTGAGLALICLGAILAFAVTGTPSFLNLHTAGWVLMLVGLVGLVLPRRMYGWLGRRTLVRRYPGGRLEQRTVPTYASQAPRTQTIVAGLPPRPTMLDDPGADLIDNPPVDPIVDDPIAGGPIADDPIVDGPRSAYAPPADDTRTEVIEDVYEQP